jgi:hypothetical protein
MHITQHISWVNPLNNEWANRVSGSNTAEINKWQRLGLNQRPRAYELADGKATSGLLSRPLASFQTDRILFGYIYQSTSDSPVLYQTPESRIKSISQSIPD